MKNSKVESTSNPFLPQKSTAASTQSQGTVEDSVSTQIATKSTKALGNQRMKPQTTLMSVYQGDDSMEEEPSINPNEPPEEAELAH